MKFRKGIVILPSIYIDNSTGLVDDLKYYAKKRGFKTVYARKRAYASWVNKQRKKDGKEEKLYLTIE